MSEAEIEIAKLVIAVLGGIVIAWYWNQRKHTLDQYRYLDEIYHDLLRLYRENPRFGDPESTEAYADTWQGEDSLRYHYFAMTVHSVMETIYDIYRGRIPDEWLSIFQYHTRLHAQWIRSNKNANRPGYVSRVLASEPT